MAKTNYTLPDSYSSQVEEESKRLGVSKRTVINLALYQYFQSKIITDKLLDSFRSITQRTKAVNSMVIEGGSYNAEANLLPAPKSSD